METLTLRFLVVLLCLTSSRAVTQSDTDKTTILPPESAVQGQPSSSSSNQGTPNTSEHSLHTERTDVAPELHDRAPVSDTTGNASTATEQDKHADFVVKLLEPTPKPLYSEENVEQMLVDAEDLLYMDSSRRDVAAGVAGLRKLASMAETMLGAPKKRALYNVPTQQLAVVDIMAGKFDQDQGQSLQIVRNTSLAPLSKPDPSVVEDTLVLEAPRMLDAEGLALAAEAMFTLAVLEASGVAAPYVEHNPAAAHFRIHQAASAGSQDAKIAISDRFFQGRHVAKDCQLGMGYAKPVAKTILEDAEQAGKTLPATPPVRLRDRWMSGNYVSADDRENAPDVINLEEDMAGRGNVDAQRRLAYRRLVGRGVEANPEAALRDFEVAAAEGDPYALFNIGYMHLRGVGVPRNYTQAQEYFLKAADQGLSAGWNGIGVLHYNGQGVPRNLTAARIAFEKGADLNNTDCLLNLGMMYAYGMGVDLDEAYAQELFERAQLLGHWRAGYSLAMLADSATTLPRDCGRASQLLRTFFETRAGWEEELREAVKALDRGDEWGALVRYLRLAEMGSETGAANGAWMLQRNLGAVAGQRRCDLAANLLKRSAALNSTSSMAELGAMCLDSSHCSLSSPCGPEEAIQHYSRAVELGSVEAALGLAWMHWRGLATPRNATAARQLLLKAMYWSEPDVHGHGALVALLALDLERLLQPLLGPTPYVSLAAWVSKLRRNTLLRVLPEETVLEVSRRLRGLASQPLGSMRSMLSAVAWDQLEPDSLTLLALVLLLGAVMWLRSRAQRHGAVHPLGPETEVAAAPTSDSPGFEGSSSHSLPVHEPGMAT